MITNRSRILANPYSFRFASDELKHDEQLIIATLSKNMRAFHDLPDDLRNNINFLIKLMKSGLQFSHLIDERLCSYDFLTKLLPYDDAFYNRFDENLRRDADFIKRAAKINSKIILRVFPEYITAEMCVDYIKNGNGILKGFAQYRGQNDELDMLIIQSAMKSTTLFAPTGEKRISSCDLCFCFS